jgi:hypothetical protein
MFRFFPALKRVKLYLVSTQEESLEDPRKQQGLKNLFTLLLNAHKQVFPGGQTPTVSLHEAEVDMLTHGR